MIEMSHTLEKKIVALRHRVRRLAAVHALSVAAVALLGTVVAVGSADYWLRFQDRGLRLFASLAALAVVAWSLFHVVRSIVAARLGDGELARRVERHFPALRDRLLSAVEFLGHAENDPTAGSAALRRELIARVTAEARNVEFSAVLDRRPTARAVAVLAAGLLLSGVLIEWPPALARIALTRLANPFGETPWPRATHLAIRQPSDRVGAESPFRSKRSMPAGRGCRRRSASTIASKTPGAPGWRKPNECALPRPIGGAPRRLSATVRLSRRRQATINRCRGTASR